MRTLTNHHILCLEIYKISFDFWLYARSEAFHPYALFLTRAQNGVSAAFIQDSRKKGKVRKERVVGIGINPLFSYSAYGTNGKHMYMLNGYSCPPVRLLPTNRLFIHLSVRLLLILFLPVQKKLAVILWHLLLQNLTTHPE